MEEENMRRKNINKIILPLALLFFLALFPHLGRTEIYSSDPNCTTEGNGDYCIYDCTDFYLAAGKCLDSSYENEFLLGYYKCDGRGGCVTQDRGYHIYCTFEGYPNNEHRCKQATKPPRGFRNYQECASACKQKPDEPAPICDRNSECELRGGVYKCKQTIRWVCRENYCCHPNPNISCTDAYPCTRDSQCHQYSSTVWHTCKEGSTPPDTTGYLIGAGKCCGVRGDDGSGGCTPSCSDPRCTVTDENCRYVNRFFDPDEHQLYKVAQSGGQRCKGEEGFCLQDDNCEGQMVCATASCYKPETNNPPPKPTSIKIYEDLPGSNFHWTTNASLSESENTRTLIRYPYPNSGRRTEINNLSLPQGARGLRTRLRIKGDTVNTETEVGGSPRVLGTHNPFYSFPNIPRTDWSWFAPGYKAHFRANFESLNKCDDSWKEGASRRGWFTVNTPPVLRTATISGNTTGATEQGCVPAARYTGNEANRELTFKIAATDVDTYHAAVGSDRNHRMNAAVIWLVKDGQTLDNEINTLKAIGPGRAIVDPNKIGIMIDTAGGIYRYSGEGWGREDDGGIYINHNGRQLKIATISMERVKHAVPRFPNNNDTTEMDIKITFEKDIPISGRYTLWAGMMDNLTLFQAQPHGTFTDQRSIKITGETWNFDFVNPKLQDISLKPKSPEDQRRLDLKWNSTDNIPNGIRPNHTVVNVYKTGTTPAHPVIRETPSPQQTVQNPHSGEQIPPQEDIGKMQTVTNGMPNSGWFHPNAGQTEMTANVGTNSEGKIHFYITTYDRACNYEQTGKDGTPGINPVELNKWITTKGGVFYSQGTVSYPTDGLDQKHNLGTELISSRTGGLYKVLDYAGTNMNPAVAKRITDVNNNAGLFDALKENFERIKPSLSEAKLISTPFFTALECYDPKGCIYRTNRLEGFFYSGKIIIIPLDGQSNITIIRDIKEGFSSTPGDNQGEHALYIFTEGNINIGYPNGSSSDGGTLQTDQIDAFLITKGNINILPEALEGGFHDKVLVNGGIIALGEVGSSPAFSLQRTLGLLNPNHPVLTANYHPKYAVFSELFFGLQTNAYKREVGFKPM